MIQIINLNLGTLSSKIEILANIFALSYLQRQGCAMQVHGGKIKAEVDNIWNFGGKDIFEIGFPIIKAEENRLFVFCSRYSYSNQDELNHFSTYLESLYCEVIAHLIVKNHTTLPTDNLSIAYCANHNLNHFTMMLANFDGINRKQYEAI